MLLFTSQAMPSKYVIKKKKTIEQRFCCLAVPAQARS